ncbi:hypothetical protein B0H10DRAFT_2223869 [Mycena sp. CBHHK59/15]|nr:hypothetical protein B0H10DRAFT_2223869 [Mycena sp. CBHHK59/15]
MPEERTVSRFTQYNSNDCANQKASTIVATTKIYQHNRREDREITGAPLSKPPSLNWRSVKTLMTAPTVISNASDAPPVARVSDDCEAGLAAVNDTSGSSESDAPFGSLDFSIEREGVDITNPYFRDCLSDEPVQGADKIRRRVLVHGPPATHVPPGCSLPIPQTNPPPLAVPLLGVRLPSLPARPAELSVPALSSRPVVPPTLVFEIRLNVPTPAPPFADIQHLHVPRPGSKTHRFASHSPSSSPPTYDTQEPAAVPEEMSPECWLVKPSLTEQRNHIKDHQKEKGMPPAHAPQPSEPEKS